MEVEEVEEEIIVNDLTYSDEDDVIVNSKIEVEEETDESDDDDDERDVELNEDKIEVDDEIQLQQHFHEDEDEEVPQRKRVFDENSGLEIIPVEENQTNKFSIARGNLQLSTIPDTLPCREKEREDILNTIERCVIEIGRGAFVSGVPGTGKTATVHDVVRHLLDKADKGSIPKFRFVSINGMMLSEPNQAYSLLLRDLSDRNEKHAPAQAAATLDKRFQPKNRPPPFCTVVLLDEIDYLVTHKQQLLYNFFEWPTRRNSGLVVLGISNTMNLPEQMMSRITRLSRVPFKPYTKHQIEAIIVSRLSGLDAFDSKAVSLCASKIASLSGDVRRALEVCRRAASIAERKMMEVMASQESWKVTMDHIDAAIAELNVSPKTQFLNNLAMHEKIFMYCIHLELRQTGAMETTFEMVAQRHLEICAQRKLTSPMNISVLSSICYQLSQLKLIISSSVRDDLDQKIMLNVTIDDISVAMTRDEKCYAIAKVYGGIEST